MWRLFTNSELFSVSYSRQVTDVLSGLRGQFIDEFASRSMDMLALTRRIFGEINLNKKGFFREISKHGSVELLEYAISQVSIVRSQDLRTILSTAARYGQLEMYKYLLPSVETSDILRSAEVAAQYCSLDTREPS